MHQPAYCSPPAYELFARQLPVLNTTAGLFKAALAVSMHALDDVTYADYARRVDHLGGRVLQDLRSKQLPAVLAHLHRVLFDEEDFRGNHSDYYSPLNSYLPAVFETRQGIPITLTLIYKLVAQRVGITVCGLNTPGHFLARIESDDGPTIVDPFAGGRVLCIDEVRSQVARITGQVYPDAILLRPASHVDWLRRIINNLQTVFQATGRGMDLEAMNELQEALRTQV